jgi:predicted DsbA family dithiol-disulfide isomerase
MRLPPIQPRSRLAHEAAKWAQTQDQFDAYNRAVFRAFFERGEDIGNIDLLVQLANDLELDAVSLRVALKSRKFEPSVIADEHEAAELGVHAVPAFVANRVRRPTPRSARTNGQPRERIKGEDCW